MLYVYFIVLCYCSINESVLLCDATYTTDFIKLRFSDVSIFCVTVTILFIAGLLTVVK